MILTLSNVTGRHRGPKRRSESFGLITERRHYKGRHRVPARDVTWGRLWTIVECGIARFLCAMRVYSTFGHHPHPLGYLYAKFRFCGDLRCWASPWRKSRIQSLSHSTSLNQLRPIWCPGNRSFRFGIQSATLTATSCSNNRAVYAV